MWSRIKWSCICISNRLRTQKSKPRWYHRPMTRQAAARKITDPTVRMTLLKMSRATQTSTTVHMPPDRDSRWVLEIQSMLQTQTAFRGLEVKESTVNAAKSPDLSPRCVSGTWPGWDGTVGTDTSRGIMNGIPPGFLVRGTMEKPVWHLSSSQHSFYLNQNSSYTSSGNCAILFICSLLFCYILLFYLLSGRSLISWPLNKVLQVLLRSCDFSHVSWVLRDYITHNTKYIIAWLWVDSRKTLITVIYLLYLIFFFLVKQMNAPAVIRCHINQKCTFLFKKFVVSMIPFKEMFPIMVIFWVLGTKNS